MKLSAIQVLSDHIMRLADPRGQLPNFLPSCTVCWRCV